MENIFYIYKIVADNIDPYFGSSYQPPCERKSKHNQDYKRWKKNQNAYKTASVFVIDKDPLNWRFEIIEYLPAGTTLEESLLKENEYIKNNPCVNINQSIQTKEDLREYKRLWAEQDRRKKGIEPRKELTEEEKAEKAEEQRQKHNESRRQEFALLTEEEKEEIRKKDRENYHKKEQTQEQKDKAKERAKKQREEIKANPAEMERIREYKRIKAQEKRNKEKESNEPSYYELHKDKIKEKYSTPEYKEARNKRLREKTAAATDL